MIEHKSLHELSVASQAVYHVHDFYHMEVDWFVSKLDYIDCINDDVN